MKLLVIDNYDSFTFNLVQYLGELGAISDVVRNDAVTVEEVGERGAEGIVISPGPCTPREAGISVEVVRRFAGQLPILGVCLGHQSIAAAYGGEIIAARTLMHGKTSMIHHTGKNILRGLPNPFEATRYHSLGVGRDSLPPELEVTAWTDDGEIMGMCHRELFLVGVQFHPESILTGSGKALLRNFLEDVGRGEVAA